jgi:hypothetical protein
MPRGGIPTTFDEPVITVFGRRPVGWANASTHRPSLERGLPKLATGSAGGWDTIGPRSVRLIGWATVWGVHEGAGARAVGLARPCRTAAGEVM